MKKLLTLLFGMLLLIRLTLSAQPQERFPLLSELENMPADSLTLDIYAMNVNLYMQQDLPRALRIVRHTKKRFEGVTVPPSVEGKFYTIAGMAYQYAGSVDTALHHYLRGKELFEAAGDDFGRGVALSAISEAQQAQGDLEAATETMLEYLEIAETTGDSMDVGRANIMVGEILYVRERDEAAIRYFSTGFGKLKRFYEQLTGQGDIVRANLQMMLDAAIRLTELEQRQQRPERAQYWMDWALRVAERNKQPAALAKTYSTRANLHYRNGRFDEALADFETAQQYYQQLGGSHGELLLFRDVSRLYLDRKQVRRALPLLHRYRGYEIANPVVSPDPEVSRLLARAHRQLGNMDSVAFYQELLIETMDSTYRVETAARVEEVQTRYETEKKEATIAEQQTELNLRAQRQRWTLFGLLAAALLGGIIFYLYRRQQRVSQELARKNQQNEFLVKEIHHRTKNNLQVLSSLLALQSDYITDPAALDAVTEGRNRVQSIGLLHQQLYTGTELETVDPKKYFSDLGDHLLDTFGREDEVQIRYRIDLPQMPVDEAISLGLIANELLTNSLKYAYPNGTEGVIHFELHEDGKQKVLQVRDEGTGAKTTTAQGTGFGRDLVDLLREKLNGTIREEYSAAGWTTVVRW